MKGKGEKAKELIPLFEKHFPDHAWLENLKRFGCDDIVITVHPRMFAPGVEVCEICGCGRSEEIQQLFRKALRAIKAKTDWVRSHNLVENLQEIGNSTIKDMLDVLNNAEKANTTKFKFCDNEMLEEVILHVLCRLGYANHGTSVYGSWIVEKGEAALAALDWWFDEDDKKETAKETEEK